MSRIKGKDTGPELCVRKALWRRGLRYRIQYKLPGRPDIAFPSKRIAVFIDGCFWHGCKQHGVAPTRNSEFWKKKLDGNRARDKKVNKQLHDLGWAVIRIWEHEVRSDVEAVTDGIEAALLIMR